MKSIKLIIIHFFLVCYSWMSYGQEITYGSNHGKYISISNTNIYFEEYGSGIPLLLLNGGYGSIHDFQQVIPQFAKHFKIIAIDSPGHGRSEQADSLSYDLMSYYFSDMIDQLNLDSVYIMGWSDGGITALLLAEKRPEKVKKIIASGANSRKDGIKTKTLELLRGINPSYVENNQKEWLADYKSKSPEKDKWAKYITDMSNMYTKDELINEQMLSNISAEVLLVFGDRDVIKLEHGIELYQKIIGSSLCILPNTSHGVFSDCPELISKIGIEFLTK